MKLENIKKITLLTTSNLAFDQRLHRVIGTLLEESFQVQIYSRKTISSQNLTYNPSPSDKNNFFKNHLIKTFFQNSWLFYAEYNLRLFIQLLITKADIIYAVDADTLLAATLLKKMKSCKLIYDAHEYFEQSPEIVQKKIIQKIWNWITKYGVKHADYCITVCNSLSEILSRQFEKQFFVIRNIPKQDALVSRISNSSKIIWYQGVLNIGRGLPEMIECMTMLPNYTLMLAGEGDIMSELKIKVQNLQLEQRVIFLGKLNSDQLKQIISQATLGINLLDSSSLNYYYSLANRTFDFIYAALPCIHMNFPEYKDLAKKYQIGVLIDNLSSENILNAIFRLEDDDYYNTCVRSCKQAALENNWELESVTFKRILEKC